VSLPLNPMESGNSLFACSSDNHIEGSSSERYSWVVNAM
jgi:hypothetical protein